MITEAEIKKHASAQSFRRGQRLYYEGAVMDLNVDDCEIEGEVLSSDGFSSYKVELELFPDKNSIFGSYCDCPAFQAYNGICKHCVAVLLEYIERVEDTQELFSDFTEIQKGMALKTTDSLKQLIYQEADKYNLPMVNKQSIATVEIEPVVVNTTFDFYVEFKIGSSQMYLIKDLYEFVARFDTEETYSYGKKLEFVHTKEVLTEQAKDYLEFIEDWCNNHADRYEKHQYSYYQHTVSYEKVRSIPLSGNTLERLLGLVKSNQLFVEMGRSEKWYLPISREKLNKQFIIKRVDDGIEVSVDPIRGYVGRTKWIFFGNTGIFVQDKNDIQDAKGLIECILSQEEQKVFVEEGDIPAFCVNMLPKLRRIFQEKLVNFNPDDYKLLQLTLKVYFDAPQKNMVTMRPVACYGEEEYSVYDTKTQVGSRDFAKEQEIVKLVNHYGTAFDAKHQAMVLHENDDLLYDLLTDGVMEMQTMAEVFMSDAMNAFRINRTSTITLGVSISSGLLTLDVDVEGITMEEMIEVLSRYDRKKKYHRLKNGSFIQMENSSLDELSELKQGLLLTDKQLESGQVVLPTYRTFFLDEQLKKGQNLQYTRSSTFKKLVRNMKTIEENDIEIPVCMEGVLREYQKNGFFWMKTLKQNGFGGILADDMGLGKTIQVITLLASEQEEQDKLRVLIVTPASLVYNWKSELERFAPQLPAKMVVGTASERKAILNDKKKKEILITSYDLLKRDLTQYEGEIFQIQIIDEAQYVKNGGTQATKAVKSIQAQFRLALTGTPVENRLSELWSIFDYAMPGFLYGAKQFKDQLESPIVKENDTQALERLKKMVTPFILRRKKQEVLKDLPDKVEENRIILLEKEQQKLYDAHVKRIQVSLSNKTEEEFKTSKLQILAELTKLRQICCDPRLFLDQFGSESAKLDACIDLIQNAVAGGHKMILFSQFTTMFEYIQKRLDVLNIKYYTLTGGTKKEKRAQMVQDFQNDDTSVFCISLKAGGTGLNLTAADIVIHYDPWWNVAVQEQATDRAHRIGQKQAVTVYKLIAKGTIEEKIVALQEKKKELADQILEGEGVASTSLSKEDLMELLT